MSEQLTLFESLPPEPEGLHYAADFVPPETEQKLIFGIRDLPLLPFQVRGDAVGRFVRFSIRLRLAAVTAVRTDPDLAGRDRRKGRNVRRPRDPDPAGSLH